MSEDRVAFREDEPTHRLTALCAALAEMARALPGFDDQDDRVFLVITTNTGESGVAAYGYDGDRAGYAVMVDDVATSLAAVLRAERTPNDSDGPRTGSL